MKSYIILGIVAAVGIAAIFHPPARSALAVIPASTPGPLANHRRSISAAMLVYVAGAVERPGLYHMAPGSRTFDAVRLAGGMRRDADAVAVNLAEPLADGQEVAVPIAGQPAKRRLKTGSNRRKKKKSIPSTADALIDLNAADAATLAQLPGIGSEMAQRLVQFREANGAFVNLDELADVAGMTPRKIDAVTPYLVINH